MELKPHESAPEDGTVHCVLHPDVIATVKAGEPLPEPSHFGENEKCAWEYAR